MLSLFLFCLPCFSFIVYFGHKCLCAHQYADISLAHVVHMSAQEDTACVISKVCLRSPPDLPSSFLEITIHFPDLQSS